jgi:hypothetical protein
LRHIASQFSAGYKSVERHQECIAELLQEARRQEASAAAIELDAQLNRVAAITDKMLDACDTYLVDPADPSRYALAPRAEDVTVIYTKPGAGGRDVRTKEKLSVLLDRIERSPKFKGVTFERVETRASDPRDLLLKTAEQIRRQLELHGRLTGRFNSEEEKPKERRQEVDLALVKIEEQRELGREITREEAERLVKEDTESYTRLVRQSGQGHLLDQVQ